MTPVKANVLVVDDNRDDIHLLVEILSMGGHVVRPALDGATALAAARAYPPDLIILDVQMPVIDGYATCRELKADERTRNIPVIFISAGSDVFDKVQAFAAGAVDYISKPFQPEEVVARIDNQLGIYALQRRLEQQNQILQQEIAERQRVEAELLRHREHLEEQVALRTIELRNEIVERKRAEAAVQAQADGLSRANAELMRALRLKDEFLAMISHELRTPLNAVLGITEGLKEEAYGPLSPRQQQALERVRQSGQHLHGIISDILDLTRIEAGAIHLDIAPISLDELCQTTLQLVAERARRKDLRLMQAMAFGVVSMRGDERRLTQILVNLLDNAVKFTPAQGTVGLEVETDAAQERIMFTVWDTGIGIAAEDMERLFRPFTQVDGRLARSYEGIGLGLTLVHRLTELHGGSVQVASVPGAGSRFTIALPWSEADNIRLGHPATAVDAAPPVWFPAPRMLVADDHEPTLELYEMRLTRQGCVVRTARTGAEALALIRAERPDIVLLDIQMPEIDGLDVIRQVREDATLAAMPIIAVTALAMPGDRERVLAAGATAYLAKPVGFRCLSAAIAAALAGAESESPQAGG